jgi:hypothetical protein
MGYREKEIYSRGIFQKEPLIKFVLYAMQVSGLPSSGKPLLSAYMKYSHSL